MEQVFHVDLASSVYLFIKISTLVFKTIPSVAKVMKQKQGERERKRERERERETGRERGERERIIGNIKCV
jgi:hypothetical protein